MKKIKKGNIRRVYRLLFFHLCVLPATVFAQVDLNDGLIAHFDFNGGPGDRSGNGYHGTVQGAELTEDRFGNCRRAYKFSASPNPNVISIPYSILDRKGSFSVSVWVKTNRPGVVITAANLSRNNEYFIQLLPTANIGMTVRANPARSGQRIDGTIPVTDDLWHHIVTTRDMESGIMSLYVDGVKDLETNRVLAGNELPRERLEVLPNGLHIGADQDCLGGCWDANQQIRGVIDDVWFFDRVITEEEITALFEIDETVDYPEFRVSDEVNVCNDLAELDAGPGFDSYLWSTGETTQSIDVNSPGVYQVEASFNGCVFIKEITVAFSELPDLSIRADGEAVGCSDLTIDLTASQGFDEYIWSNGARGRQITVDAPGEYFVRGVGLCGERTSETITILDQDEDVIDISSSGDVVSCNTDPVTITANEGFDEYLWSNGERGREIEVSLPGQYFVTATNGCGEQVSQTIVVRDEELADYFVPNTFTPNGDGKNETFQIDERLSGGVLKVVDRWGKQIYVSTDYQNEWDGKDIVDGVYYYIIYHPCSGQSLKGWVKIMR